MVAVEDAIEMLADFRRELERKQPPRCAHHLNMSTRMREHVNVSLHV